VGASLFCGGVLSFWWVCDLCEFCGWGVVGVGSCVSGGGGCFRFVGFCVFECFVWCVVFLLSFCC